MKKWIAFVLALVCVFDLAGCASTEQHTIEFTIPAGNTEDFVFSSEEISPKAGKLKISAGAGISDDEMMLLPVEVCEENAYEPILLKQGKPVRVDVEKGAWFKIGVAKRNTADVPIAVEVIVENVEIRIE